MSDRTHKLILDDTSSEKSLLGHLSDKISAKLGLKQHVTEPVAITSNKALLDKLVVMEHELAYAHQELHTPELSDEKENILAFHIERLENERFQLLYKLNNEDFNKYARRPYL